MNEFSPQAERDLRSPPRPARIPWFLRTAAPLPTNVIASKAKMKNYLQRSMIAVISVLLLVGGAVRGATPNATQAPSPPTYRTMRVVQAWIPMRDGVRLAVNLYMPDVPMSNVKPGERFPAILEYLPYRKDDWTLARDSDLHSYFVRRGYVAARVDIRGTGASEGTPPDREYSDQEHQDGLTVIDWLSKQPWSNGNVGMMGISWVASMRSRWRGCILRH